jgi:hypothetical protein
MTNKFAAIGCTGVVVSAVCLTAAAMIGGQVFRDHGFDFSFLNHYGPSCAVTGTEGSDSRSLEWSGGDGVKVSLPANVHYVAGTGEKLVITGNKALVDHVHLRGSRISLDCSGGDYGPLDITLPGRFFRSFALLGSGDMDLKNIDQPKLEIVMAGSGNVTASGRTDRVELNMAGSGDADLSGLTASRAEVNLAGSGDVDIAARDDLELNVAGSGDVRLHGEPEHIRSHIFGSGEIIHNAGAPPAPQPPTPAPQTMPTMPAMPKMPTRN